MFCFTPVLNNSAVSCGGISATRCYSFPGVDQNLFCQCNAGQLYNGSSCVTTATSSISSPVCYATNFTDVCQCPFGSILKEGRCGKHNNTLQPNFIFLKVLVSRDIGFYDEFCLFMDQNKKKQKILELQRKTLL